MHKKKKQTGVALQESVASTMEALIQHALQGWGLINIKKNSTEHEILNVYENTVEKFIQVNLKTWIKWITLQKIKLTRIYSKHVNNQPWNH